MDWIAMDKIIELNVMWKGQIEDENFQNYISGCILVLAIGEADI